MRNDRHAQLREILRAAGDEGIAESELIDVACGKKHAQTIKEALQAMPDTYIDRWEDFGKKYQPVWCTVPVPDDAPHPDSKD